MAVANTILLPSAYTDCASFVLDNDTCQLIGLNNQPRLRCASVIKPLYMWAASYLESFSNEQYWLSLAEPAIVTSSNLAVSTAWQNSSTAILSQLHSLTGSTWPREAQRLSWGSVGITARTIAKAYAILLQDATQNERAATVLSLMRQVDPEQCFGIKNVITKSFTFVTSQPAIKCGWYVDKENWQLLTHAVVIVQLSAHKYAGIVALTALPYSSQKIKQYLELDKAGGNVLPWHEARAGAILRSLVVATMQNTLANA